MSLLREYEKKAQLETAAAVVSAKDTSVSERAYQVFALVLVFHLIAGLLAFAFVTFLSMTDIEVTELPSTNPMLLRIAGMVIPLLAGSLATAIAVRQVYLAQVVAGPAMLGCGVLFLLERWALGVPSGILEAPIVPLLLGPIGFGIGLLVGGKKHVEEVVQFTPIDAWARDVKPLITEIKPEASLMVRRVIQALIVTYFVNMIGAFVLGIIIAPAFNHNAGALFTFLESCRSYIFAFALFAGGFVSGIHSTNGWRQGIVLGVLSLTTTWLNASSFDENLLTESALFIGVAAIGGQLGRLIITPTQIYVGPKQATREEMQRRRQVAR